MQLLLQGSRLAAAEKTNFMMAGLILLLIIGLGVAGLLLGLNILKNYKPGRKRIQADLKEIKAELQPLVSELVPWNKEELQQLSLNVIHKTKKKGVIYNAKGVFTSIYHEPLIAWYYRKYVSPKEDSLLYVRTSNHQFVYRIKGDETEVLIDDQFIGKIDSNGKLYDYKKKNLLAQINKGADQLALPVLVNQKPVGALTNLEKAPKKVNQRAMELVGDMQPEEENLFLALSLLELVKVHK